MSEFACYDSKKDPFTVIIWIMLTSMSTDRCHCIINPQKEILVSATTWTDSVSKIVKLIEIESRTVVTRDSCGVGMGS